MPVRGACTRSSLGQYSKPATVRNCRAVALNDWMRGGRIPGPRPSNDGTQVIGRTRRADVDDPFKLARFEEAQDAAGTYQRALSELRAGDKRSHWMWFIFPQVAGLGLSPTSQKYAISSLDEARAYLSHPLLGARLRECFQAVLAVDDRNAEQIFGGIDARKLHSSSTLFLRAAPEDPVFRQILDKYFGGIPDEASDRLLGLTT